MTRSSPFGLAYGDAKGSADANGVGSGTQLHVDEIQPKAIATKPTKITAAAMTRTNNSTVPMRGRGWA